MDIKSKHQTAGLKPGQGVFSIGSNLIIPPEIMANFNVCRAALWAQYLASVYRCLPLGKLENGGNS